MQNIARKLAVLFIVIGVAQCVSADDRQLAHMVFFTLQQDTDASREALVAACQKYLSGHEGTVYFSVGTLAEELDREVNDLEFDIALHLVFASRKAHDTYQTHPRHLEFIEKNKHLWSSVRVFDSYLSPAGHHVLASEARGFAGMIRGKVVQVRPGQFVLAVAEVTNVWRTNRAEDAESLVGKRVLVASPADDGPIAEFVQLVKPGETVHVDVAHRIGDTLTVLELTEEQRERVK